MLVFLSNTQLELTKSKEPITRHTFKVLNTSYTIFSVVSKMNSNLYDITLKNDNLNKPLSKITGVGKTVVNKKIAELKYITSMNHRVNRSIEHDKEVDRRNKVSKKGKKISKKLKKSK